MYIQKRNPKHFHRYFVDNETNDIICLCGKVRGAKKTDASSLIPKESKYHNQTSFYGGYGYDSIKEAQQAMILDDQKKRGIIKDWQRQYPVEVYAPNGQKLFTMKVDFLVRHNDDSYELQEVKGMETDIFRLKLKCLESLWLPENPEYTYTLIK